MNWRIAWHATQNLMICCGGIGLVAFVANLKWPIMLFSAVVLSSVWAMLYKIEKNSGMRNYHREKDGM